MRKTAIGLFAVVALLCGVSMWAGTLPPNPFVNQSGGGGASFSGAACTVVQTITTLNGATAPTCGAITGLAESVLSLTDITNNNASTSKHGFLPKLSGVATDVLHGDGSYSGVANTTGNAATATALAANGANCSAGNYPLGVDASGNAESCTAVPAAGATLGANTFTGTQSVPTGSSGSPSVKWSGGGRGFYMGNAGLVFVDDLGNKTWAPGIGGHGIQIQPEGGYCFSSVSLDATQGPDSCITRVNAKVTTFDDGAGHASPWQAGDANGTTRPTCAAGYRGTYWHKYGGAGVADTVAVCCKNVSDVYLWSTAFLNSGTCS